MAPSSLPDQIADLHRACTRCESCLYDATTVRTADLRALLSAYEQKSAENVALKVLIEEAGACAERAEARMLAAEAEVLRLTTRVQELESEIASYHIKPLKST